MLVMCVSLALGLLFFFPTSVDTGFLSYLQEREVHHLTPVAQALELNYRGKNSWSELFPNERSWERFVSAHMVKVPHRHHAEAPIPDAGSRGLIPSHGELPASYPNQIEADQSVGSPPHWEPSTTTEDTTTATENTESTTTAIESCALIPEETEGPYPLTSVLSNSAMVRSDITEGKSGVPLQVKLKLVNVNNGCEAITDAYIYFWHCDKDGVYSGYSQARGQYRG
jgi:hypothetical protein